MQALLSFLPRFGPVLPGAAMSSLVPIAEVSVRHFGTSADMSGQFGTGAEVSYEHFGTSAEMSWVRSVLGPKCLDTRFTGPKCNRIHYILKELTSGRVEHMLVAF